MIGPVWDSNELRGQKVVSKGLGCMARMAVFF